MDAPLLPRPVKVDAGWLLCCPEPAQVSLYKRECKHLLHVLSRETRVNGMLGKAENWPPPVSSVSPPATFSLLSFFGCIYTSNKSKLRYLTVKNEQRHSRAFVNEDRGQGLVLSYHIIHDSIFSVSLTSPSPNRFQKRAFASSFIVRISGVRWLCVLLHIWDKELRNIQGQIKQVTSSFLCEKEDARSLIGKHTSEDVASPVSLGTSSTSMN